MVDYFERNWASRGNTEVRFRAFEATGDLDMCALVRSHRQCLLCCLSPSRSMAQCLCYLVTMQWADASGEVVPDGPSDGEPWLECKQGRRAQVENERMKGLENGDWGGAPKERSIWRGVQLEKKWARQLEPRDWGGAQLASEKGRGLQIRYWRGVQFHNQKVRGLEGSAREGPSWRKHFRGPEIRDWRGHPLEGEKDWRLEGYAWRVSKLENQGLRRLKGYTWRMAQLED